MERSKCLHCQRTNYLPNGSTKAKLLIVVDTPMLDDDRQGIIMSGRTGDIMRSELQRAGIQPSVCRFVSLWMHEQVKGNTQCVELGMKNLLKEMHNHPFILIAGASAARSVLDDSLYDSVGIERKLVGYDAVVMAMPDPSKISHMPIGETRLALEKMNRRMR